MTDRDNSPAPKAADRWILGGGVVGAFSLAFQMTRPLDQLATAPEWFNWICCAALVLFLMRFLLRGKKDEQWLSGMSLFALFGFVGLCEPWAAYGSAEFASRTAELLSTTHTGVAWTALVFTWLALGIGLLCGRGVLLCFVAKGPWQRATAWLFGLMIAAFGAHGVMGYASGNSSLLLP